MQWVCLEKAIYLSLEWSSFFSFLFPAPMQNKAQCGLLIEQWNCSMQENLHDTLNHCGESVTVRSAMLLYEPRLLENMCFWDFGSQRHVYTYTQRQTHMQLPKFCQILLEKDLLLGSAYTICTLLINEVEDPWFMGWKAFLAGWSSMNQHNKGECGDYWNLPPFKDKM